MELGQRVRYPNTEAFGTVTSISDHEDGDTSVGDIYVEWDDGEDNGYYSPNEVETS